MLFRFYVLIQSTVLGVGRRTRRDDAGQATAEYALVLLGGAAVAVLLIAWANGGAFNDLFGKVLDKITGSVG